LNAAVWDFRFAVIGTTSESRQSSLTGGLNFGVHYTPQLLVADVFQRPRAELGRRGGPVELADEPEGLLDAPLLGGRLTVLDVVGLGVLEVRQDQLVDGQRGDGRIGVLVVRRGMGSGLRDGVFRYVYRRTPVLFAALPTAGRYTRRVRLRTSNQSG
jgi:hypothetical protein